MAHVQTDLPLFLATRNRQGHCPAIGTVIYHVRPRNPEQPITSPHTGIGVLENRSEQFTIIRLVGFVGGSLNDNNILVQHLRNIPWDHIRRQNPRLLLQLYAPWQGTSAPHPSGILLRILHSVVPMTDWDTLVVLLTYFARAAHQWVMTDVPRKMLCLARFKYRHRVVAVVSNATVDMQATTRLLKDLQQHCITLYMTLYLVTHQLTSDLMRHFPSEGEQSAVQVMLPGNVSIDTLRYAMAILKRHHRGLIFIANATPSLQQGVHVAFEGATHRCSVPAGHVQVSASENRLRKTFPQLGPPTPIVNTTTNPS